MSHEHDSHDKMTWNDFFTEYWILLLFGGFFLMTMFLPLLFLGNIGWLFKGIVYVVLALTGLFTAAIILGRIQQS